MDPLSDLAAGLRKLGLTPTEIGRALAPNSSKSTWYTTGARLLNGARAPALERLAELSQALGVRITFEPGRVLVERVV